VTEGYRGAAVGYKQSNVVAYALCPPGDSPQAVDRRANAGECASTAAGIPTQ
jgi:hypothetical protein